MLKYVVLLIITITIQSAAGYDQFCDTVFIQKYKKLDISDVEKRMICGDKESDAYRSIPVYEAQIFLQGFLQARGHLNPVFEIKDGKLFVDAGKKSKVKKIIVNSDDHKLKKKVKTELRHLYNNRLLNTGLLNSIEGEALAQIRKRGHPCAEVRSEVDITSDQISVYLENLKLTKFGKVEKETLKGLDDRAFERYYPFKENEIFNADLLTLTEKRMTRAEVVQGTYFIEDCGEEFKLSQEFIEGPPRTIRFGAGVSTEQGPMARIKWSHNRYKSMASILSAEARASLRSQTLTGSADNFFWKNEPRRSILTELTADRQSQIDFEQVTYTARPLMKWTRDSEGYGKIYTLGPNYQAGNYHSKESSDTKSFSSVNLEGALQWMSHDYELFDIHPSEGELFSLRTDFRHPAGGFKEPILKSDLSFTKLSRLSNWNRGAIIGGLKTFLGTAWTSDKTSLQSLPPEVKYFGGGSDDIRGYYFRTLPQNDGLGSFTKAILKLELRRTHVYKESLEAFTFLDGGYFGTQSWEVDKTLFYSPGLGLRWLSPFGLVQGYWARGMKLNPNKDQGNLFFAGLGGEF